MFQRFNRILIDLFMLFKVRMSAFFVTCVASFSVLKFMIFPVLVMAICALARGYQTKTSLLSHYASRDSSNANCTGANQECSAAACECSAGHYEGDNTSCAIVPTDSLQTGYGYMMLMLGKL